MSQPTQSENGLSIECNAVFDITVVTDFKAMLLQAIAGGQQLVLEASHIERVDAAALQLLAALFRDAGPRGLEVSWSNPSESLTYAAKLVGLDGVLRL